MEQIVQKHPSGCAIACIAYVLNCEYDEVLWLFNNGLRKAKNEGFYYKEIVKVFNKIGKDYQYNYVNSKTKRKIYEKGSIVFITRSARYPFGHYLVRAKGKWMDSWINYQDNKDIRDAKAGFRKRLPGRPIYVIYPCLT